MASVSVRTPVAVFRATMRTLAMPAPDGSEMVPEMVPSVVWAASEAANVSNSVFTNMVDGASSAVTSVDEIAPEGK